MKQNLAVRSKAGSDYALVPKIGKELDPSTLQMMIGGHTILVDNGKAILAKREFDWRKQGTNSRRLPKDGRYAYLIAREQR